LFQPSRQAGKTHVRDELCGTQKTIGVGCGRPPSFSAGQRPAAASPFFHAATVKKIFLPPSSKFNGLFINQKPSQNNGAHGTLSANNKCQYAKYRGKGGGNFNREAKVKITHTHTHTTKKQGVNISAPIF